MEIKLNLIPEEKKLEIRQKIILLKILRWGLEFTATYALFLGLLFALGYITKLNLLTNTIKLSPNNISQFKSFKEYDTEIKEMNARVAQLQKIQDGQLYWSKLFAKLEGSIPDGIIINNLTTKDYAIALGGLSDNRDHLIALKDKIVADSCFSEVKLPLSDLVAQENLNFRIDFNIKRECLTQINGQ